MLNWVCHLTSLNKNPFQLGETCFAQRNALQLAIACFEYSVYTERKKKLARQLAPERNLFGFIAKRELF